MGHWGWRPLACTAFISVWVAGCNLVGDAASSTLPPTPDARVTLTAGRASERTTATGPPRVVTLAAITPSLSTARGNATGTSRASETEPALFALEVENPTCHSLATGGLICLGRVLNTLAFAVEQVEVTVVLPLGNAAPPSQRVALEQQRIEPGIFAPFRVIFAADGDEPVQAQASLSSASDGSDSGRILLTVDSLNVTLSGTTVHVDGQLMNLQDSPVRLEQYIVTVVDDADHVVAYRVIPFDRQTLQVGANARFETVVMLDASPTSVLRALVSVEATRLPT